MDYLLLDLPLQCTHLDFRKLDYFSFLKLTKLNFQGLLNRSLWLWKYFESYFITFADYSYSTRSLYIYIFLVSPPAIHPFLCFSHTHSSLYPILDPSLFPHILPFYHPPLGSCKHGNVHYLLLFFLHPPSAHRLFLTSCLVSTFVLLLIILDKPWKNINKHHHSKACLSFLLSC